MSGFSDIALPGKIPSLGREKGGITPEDLFARCDNIIRRRGAVDSLGMPADFSVSKVKVEIFDLSDAKQRKAYEKLWSTLLMKVYKGQAVVETSKDLVHRPDGTSYWQKYVEYVILGDGSNDGKTNGGTK